MCLGEPGPGGRAVSWACFPPAATGCARKPGRGEGAIGEQQVRHASRPSAATDTTGPPESSSTSGHAAGAGNRARAPTRPPQDGPGAHLDPPVGSALWVSLAPKAPDLAWPCSSPGPTLRPPAPQFPAPTHEICGLQTLPEGGRRPILTCLRGLTHRARAREAPKQPWPHQHGCSCLSDDIRTDGPQPPMTWGRRNPAAFLFSFY